MSPEHRIMKCYLLLVLAGIAVGGACKRSYTRSTTGPPVALDLIGPATVALVTGGAEQLAPNISKMGLYVTGPSKDIDSYLAIEDVVSIKPVYETNDPALIKGALEALFNFDRSNTLISSVKQPKAGLTYHLVFFERVPPAVMHFRVFSTNAEYAQAAFVFPRSDTGFAYASTNVIQWLRQVVPRQPRGPREENDAHATTPK